MLSDYSGERTSTNCGCASNMGACVRNMDFASAATERIDLQRGRTQCTVCLRGGAVPQQRVPELDDESGMNES
jgi:hypothetical protein